jgi:hypothetical protein
MRLKFRRDTSGSILCVYVRTHATTVYIRHPTTIQALYLRIVSTIVFVLIPR